MGIFEDIVVSLKKKKKKKLPGCDPALVLTTVPVTGLRKCRDLTNRLYQISVFPVSS